MKTRIILSSLAATVIAIPSSTPHVVHEKRDDEWHNTRYTRSETVASNHDIQFEMALVQTNLQNAEKRLYDISDPRSPNYGKHLSKAEVVKLFEADNKAVNAVKKWLVQSGIKEDTIVINPTKNWIRAKAPASVIEKALRTKYHVYRSEASGQDYVGTDAYSLPSSIAELVDFVLPGVSMTKLNSRASKGRVGTSKPDTSKAAIIETRKPLSDAQVELVKGAIRAGPSRVKGDNQFPTKNGTTIPDYLQICGQYMTPDCIAYLYKIPWATQSNITNSLGMYESLGEVHAQEDLDKFFELVAPYIPKGTGPQLDLINGATAPNPVEKSGGEAVLDFDMVYPIIYPQKSTLFQVKNDGLLDIFDAYLAAIDSEYCDQNNGHQMCGTYEPTNVISISYGGPEDPSNPKQAHRQCNEFMKLGLLGITAVVASGDAGVTDRAGTCQGPHHDIFIADDLCGCPYITCVGSTVVKAIDKPEIATESFSSGGGFSNIFQRPSWQEKAIGEYLLRHNPGYFAYNTSEGIIPTTGSGIYNRGGRGFPDVAAVGDNGLVVWRGRVQPFGGTSMSAPIVAAIFNRINEKRLSLGKGPIGFANIGLYQALQDHKDKPREQPSLYNDVTVGNQALGGYGDDRYYSACGNVGFSAVPGWDPVTGLGTPIYPLWESYFVEN